MTIKVKNISKSFGNKKVLDNVSFDLEKGYITALVGRNGSGKTTLLKIISQIFDQDEGYVLLDDRHIESFPELKENIAYLPDNFNYFDYETVKGAIGYYRLIYPNFDLDFANRELKEMGISQKDSIRNLSKGNKTIAGLIIVLASGADYIMVDEVVDGLDILNKGKIMRYLLDAVDEGKSIFVSSHELEELEGIADRVIYLSMDGKAKQMVNASSAEIVKIQVVAKEALPSVVKNQAIVKDKMARVYTILAEGSKENWEIILDNDEIVQYDFLPVKLEDLFYFEQGRRGENESI